MPGRVAALNPRQNVSGNRRGRSRAGPLAATGPLRTRRPGSVCRKSSCEPCSSSDGSGRGGRENSGTRGGFVIFAERRTSEARQRQRPGPKNFHFDSAAHEAERGEERGRPRPHQKVVSLNPVSAIVLLVTSATVPFGHLVLSLLPPTGDIRLPKLKSGGEGIRGVWGLGSEST